MKRFSLSLRQRFVRGSMVLIVVIASTMLLVPHAQASDEHCIHPNGTDLNVLYGISEQIVNPFCNQVDSGEYWVATGASPWLVNTSFEVVPERFVPVGSTPLEDFRAKFMGVKYVIDAGMRQERAYFIPINERLWTSIFGELVAVHPATLGTLKPLRVGEHTVQVYWVFSEMHCDGLGDVVEQNCLGPGEITYGLRATFEVTPADSADS